MLEMNMLNFLVGILTLFVGVMACFKSFRTLGLYVFLIVNAIVFHNKIKDIDSLMKSNKDKLTESIDKNKEEIKANKEELNKSINKNRIDLTELIKNTNEGTRELIRLNRADIKENRRNLTSLKNK